MTGSVSSYFVGVPGGLVMSMIAFSIVFIVIIGLMFLMMGMKHLCNAIDGTKKAAPAASAPAAAPQAAAPAKAVAAPAEDDGELLAVITAAIYAMCGTGTKVLSFAPASKAPISSSWKFMGRVQNTEGFQD
ncbi:MAG: OadG family protein [Synergistaceae bacterium]